MLSSVFSKSLWERRRSLVWWLVGLSVLVIFIVSFYPIIREQREQFEKLLAVYPKGMLALFGMNGPGGIGDFLSPPGFLGSYLFSAFVPLVFLILGIGYGANAIAGEEERHTMDLLLANPISRRRLVLEKFLALVVMLLAVATVFGVVLWAAGLSGDMGLGVDKIAAAVSGVLLLGIEFGALALAIGALSGNRVLSLGLSGGLATAAYFINGLASLASWLEPYQKLSPFYHAIGKVPLRTGFDGAGLAALLGGSLILLGVSVLAFERRDLRS